MITDIKLIATEVGDYDISFIKGDIELTSTIDTALLMSIYCERRADFSEVALSKYRRGWCGNVLLYDLLFEIGSKLWLLKQSRVIPHNLERAKRYALEALQWMIAKDIFDKIFVNTSYGSANDMLINIKTVKSNNTKEYSLSYGI